MCYNVVQMKCKACEYHLYCYKDLLFYYTVYNYSIVIGWANVNGDSKARFPLPELTSGNARPSTRPVMTANGNRSPVNSGRQLG